MKGFVIYFVSSFEVFSFVSSGPHRISRTNSNPEGWKLDEQTGFCFSSRIAHRPEVRPSLRSGFSSIFVVSSSLSSFYNRPGEFDLEIDDYAIAAGTIPSREVKNPFLYLLDHRSRASVWRRPFQKRAENTLFFS